MEQELSIQLEERSYYGNNETTCTLSEPRVAMTLCDLPLYSELALLVTQPRA